MTQGRWHVVTDIFHAALARTRVDRAAFVKEACHEDGALAAQVEALLAAHEEAGSFGDGPVLPGIPATLAPTTRLGPYAIESLLGAGGMGEVYSATDTRLHRRVAIKILTTPHRSSDDQSRFEREARAISQLAHPHICTLYDIGEHYGTNYLVMEYLEGDTLAARLEGGAIPLGQALRIGVEIASALDHAHRQGIVHRDLKPANIVLTSNGAKLLDFGVAKLQRSPDAFVGPDPLAENRLTATGRRPGTLQYMSPEQIEGQQADHRSDIWALGCVFYELFSGRTPFAGETPTALTAAILHDPLGPLGLDPSASGGALEHVVCTCLARNPEERWQSAADVGRQLEWIASQATGTVTTTPMRNGGGQKTNRTLYRALFLVMLLVAGASALFVWIQTSAPPETAPSSSALRVTVAFGENDPVIEPGGLAISPDGSTLVFAARANDGQRLYSRRLDEFDAKPIRGSDGAMAPFFSPDGHSIGFLVMGRGIFKAPLAGGLPSRICECPAGLSAAWATDGRIIFANGIGKPGPGLWMVDAAGGIPAELLRAPGSGALAYVSPKVLPAGDAVVFTIRQAGQTTIAAVNLESRKVDSLVPGGSHPHFLPPGHLVYLSSGNLFVDELDPRRLAIRGAARTLVAGVGDDQAGNGPFVLSATATLAYIPSAILAKRLVWIDHAGKSTPLNLPARSYTSVGLSPDGRQLALTVVDGTQRNIWTAETAGGPLTQLTFGNDDVFGVFTADGKRVLYTHGDAGTYNVFTIPTDAAGQPSRLTNSRNSQAITAVANNGRTLLLNDIDPTTGLDILQMDARQPASIRPFRRTPRRELSARLSPDGRWVAYASDDTGDFAIYVEPFPGPGRRRQVSPAFGLWPWWNPKGGELLYQGRDRIVSVAMREGRVVGPEATVFHHTKDPNGLAGDWTIGPDGRLLVIERAASQASEIKLLLNLSDELKR